MLFLGSQRMVAASLLSASVPGHREALGGCLLGSHHACTMPSSHFWSSCWQARLPFVYELSRCLGGGSSSLNLVPRLREFESLTAPGLCPVLPKRKAKGPFFLTGTGTSRLPLCRQLWPCWGTMPPVLDWT